MFLAAIEVDQRQRVITATDKLKEMLGGSWHIAETVKTTLQQLEQQGQAGTARMVAPVSGAVWVKADSVGDLQAVLWKVREVVVEELDLPVTFAVVSYDDFDEGKGRLEKRVRELKDSKGGEEASLLLPLMAVCQLDPNRAANWWVPERANNEQWSRRRLVSATQEARRVRGHKTLGEYLDRFDTYRRNKAEVVGAQGWKEPEQFKDLTVSGGDQYLALMKADGDGMSALVSTVKWGKLAKQLSWGDGDWARVQGRTGWPDGDRKGEVKAEQAFSWFSTALEDVLWAALKAAVDKTIGNRAPQGKTFPIVPLVREGEDTAVLCRRDLALKLAVQFGKEYEDKASQVEVFNKAIVAAGIGEKLSVSMGVLFVKQGYPFEMMWELAEELQGNAKKRRREEQTKTGYIDWEWFDSTGREEIADRATGKRYRYRRMKYELATRPWTVGDAEMYLALAERLEKLPQKRWAELEQLLWLGGDLVDLGWKRWLTHLGREELKLVNGVLREAPHWRRDGEGEMVIEEPFRNGKTPLLELGVMGKTWSGGK